MVLGIFGFVSVMYFNNYSTGIADVYHMKKILGSYSNSGQEVSSGTNLSTSSPFND
jgi:hypothetical protein